MTKMSLLRCVLLVMGLASLMTNPRIACAQPVMVTRVTYHGWTNAVSLSNGLVEAVIVPQIGRILAFQFVGQPDSNIIYQNPDLLGKTGKDIDKGTWGNFGGDKVWPSPQSDWPHYIGNQFPPDVAFDGTPQELSLLPNGVRLTTSLSPVFGLQIIRTITMSPGTPRLYLSQSLVRPAGQSGTASPLPVGVWTVTQVRGDVTVFIPSTSEKGIIPLSGLQAPAYPYWRVANGTLIGQRDPVVTHKVGSTTRAGWIAALYGGRFVLSEHFAAQPGQSYPDGGCGLEVYTNGADVNRTDQAYDEIETLGPLTSVTADHPGTLTGYWQLDTLPRTPKGDADATKLLSAVAQPTAR